MNLEGLRQRLDREISSIENDYSLSPEEKRQYIKELEEQFAEYEQEQERRDHFDKTH